MSERDMVEMINSALSFLFSNEANNLLVGEARKEVIKRFGVEVDSELAKLFSKEGKGDE